MPFLKALLFLWCFLPLRFRDMRRMSLRARRLMRRMSRKRKGKKHHKKSKAFKKGML